MSYFNLLILLVTSVISGTIGLYAYFNSDIYMVSPRTSLVYMTIPLILSATCFVCAFIKPARYFAVSSLISIAIGITAAEVYLAQPSIVNATPTRYDIMKSAATQAGRAVDSRQLSEVLMDIRAEGKDAYPTFSPTQFLLNKELMKRLPLKDDTSSFFPLTSIANTQSIYCNETGQWLVFPSDRYGFNNPDTVWDDAPISTAIVGDSFAQGACVQPDESVAALLRAKGLASATIGVGGTGSLIQLALAKEYLSDIKPPMVFWLFYEGNDLHINMPLEEKSDFLRQYLQPDFRVGLPEKTPQIDAFLRSVIDDNIDRLIKNDHLIPASSFNFSKIMRLSHLRERLGLIQCPRKDQNFALLEQVASEFRSTVEKWGGTPVVVYIPSSINSQCDLFNVGPRKDNWLYDRALSAFENAGLTILDIRAQYFDEGTPSEYHNYPGSHLSPKGYQAVAERIADLVSTLKPSLSPKGN